MQHIKPILFSFFILLLAPLELRAETYTFSSIGISIDTPDGWHTVTKQGLQRNLSSKSYGKSELNELLKQGNGQIIAVTKFPVNSGREDSVNPGLFVHLYNGAIKDIALAMNAVKAFASKNFMEFKLLEDTTLAPVGDFAAGNIQYSYSVKSPIGSATVIERLWILPLADQYLSFSTGYSAEDEAEIERTIRDSLARLTKLP